MSQLDFKLYNFATRPALLRRAIDAHKRWIETRLGTTLDESVVVETRLDLAQIGIEKVLGLERPLYGLERTRRRLRSFISSVEIPPDLPPMLAFSRATPSQGFDEMLGGSQKEKQSRLEWQDCPVALVLHSISSPVIVLNVYYHSGPSSDSERQICALIARRESLVHLIRLLETLDSREVRPSLTVYNGTSRNIQPSSWDDLVLDPLTISLLKNDFETFWERESWFRERRLPYRRGYLLHGPPGNGKSTAIRAMMSSRGLSAFTIRLFDPSVSDGDLDYLLDNALIERPSIVLLEDLDRAFPRTGESRSRISLQYLLNGLDGVATGEGLVVVATANEPAALDPAILRRPGRFDRVVRFPNPNRSLREQFFERMKMNLEPAALEQSALACQGFSFAQLREATILAGQFAFERQDDIQASDLQRGIQVLRETMVSGSNYSNNAGFVSAPQDGDTE